MKPKAKERGIKHVVAAIVGALLVGCEGGGTTIQPGATQASRTVDMPHYSFTIPAEWTGWRVKKEGGPFEVVSLAQSLCCTPQLEYQVQLLRNTVTASAGATAKQVAEDYSKREESTMIWEGAMKGRYQLYDVVRTEENLDGRTAYVMRYRTDMGAKCQKAAMYLLFPKESDNQWFIVANYSLATTREAADAMNLCKWGAGQDMVANQFADMLKGLQMR